jgi:hypothetical protein
MAEALGPADGTAGGGSRDDVDEITATDAPGDAGEPPKVMY